MSRLMLELLPSLLVVSMLPMLSMLSPLSPLWQLLEALLQLLAASSPSPGKDSVISHLTCVASFRRFWAVVDAVAIRSPTALLIVSLRACFSNASMMPAASFSSAPASKSCSITFSVLPRLALILAFISSGKHAKRSEAAFVTATSTVCSSAQRPLPKLCKDACSSDLVSVARDVKILAVLSLSNKSRAAEESLRDFLTSKLISTDKR
mmetsp:Transcript_15569/g.30627  ORF Transcript_15569/g.30627 Transcript_15569/m.30627 type:complete len:208 (+) Transcript_15569:502-1125(+)